jgi:hypothetical protein
MSYETTTLMLPADGYGDATFTRHDDGSITCEHADPRARISDELLHMVACGLTDPRASLMLADGTPARGVPGRPQDLFGAILTMDCANRRLIYRITGWEPIWLEGDSPGSYLAEWPD